MFPSKNDQILTTDKEGFKKLGDVEVPLQLDLLREQNLYEVRLNLTNSLSKLFLNTFNAFCVFQFLLSTYSDAGREVRGIASEPRSHQEIRPCS